MSPTRPLFVPERYPHATLEPIRLESPYWLGHIPFAYELVRRLRPRLIVELGTYSGSSLSAFCQAVEAAGLESTCCGVDSWEGDVHMGRLPAEMYTQVSDFFGARFPGTAKSIRSTFDDARDLFTDGAIDLLHIDGTHTYEAVRHDFESWRSKVSTSGVVIFHDVAVVPQTHGKVAAQFGVRRFFDEVRGAYPHFEFCHSNGLGVLLVGSDLPSAVRELVTEASDPAFFRHFERLGNRIFRRYERSTVSGLGVLRLLARRTRDAVTGPRP